jgi:Pvc16 N-terminal domain
MSSALAIAGVSAVLQTYLGNLYAGLSALFGSTVTVSSKAPDLVQESFAAGGVECQVNLFLHQVTHNVGWRNQDLPSVDASGRTRLSNPPLALDLHYLLTAYGSEDWQAEALLGFALLMLHENPVLTRQDVGNAIAKLPINDPLNPLSTPLGSVGLADQIELLKITPATLGREEMAWLWTALKADYRPTFPFQVSVVLIEPQNPQSVPLPVLLRNIVVEPDLTPFPVIGAVIPPFSQPAARLGQSVTVQGHRLATAAGVVLINELRGIRQTIVPTAATNASVQFTPPLLNVAGELAAGIYDLSLQVVSASGPTTTNSLPFAIAPNIDTWAPGVIPAGNTTVTVPCSPFVRPGQQVFLIIGDQLTVADPFTAPTNTPSFTYPDLQPTNGLVRARLRVDGIESRIVDRTTTPPTFAGPLVQVV